MKILFVNTFNVCPYLGGTERIADSLATYFRSRTNVKCYLAYFEDIPSSYKETVFDGKIRLKNRRDISTLKDYIKKNDVEIILIQGQFRLTSKVRKYICNDLLCKIIFAHHLYPGVENEFLELFDISPFDDSIKGFMKGIIRPLWNLYHRCTLRICYRNTYNAADRVVLLSEQLISPFISYGKFKDTCKFMVIPNMLSFTSFCNPHEVQKKEKIVLVVSRLEEKPKRISIALEVWKKVICDMRLYEWKLVIVGTGSCEEAYRKIVKQNDIPNVYFEGNQDPFVYYQKASFFLMTSSLESWGLTITEAQQMGVVPIAFDSYPSLTDIIVDRKNGRVVKDLHIEDYVNALKELMLDDKLRFEYALNAIESSKRFSKEIVGGKWFVLIKNLLNYDT